MHKQQRPTRHIGFLVSLLFLGWSIMGAWTLAPVAHAAPAANVTIDFSNQLGAPDYNGSGFLYGLNQDGSQPAGNLLSSLHPQLFRGGGAGLQPGGWTNGGLSAYQQRFASVLGQYRRAIAVGGGYQILVHDLWGDDLRTPLNQFPGDNGNWTPYQQFLNQVISDVTANHMVVQWDLWNEPDGGFWPRSQNQYLQMWQIGYQQIRSQISNAIIVGPSLSGFNTSWLTTFLTFVKANGVVPDYLSWHFSNDPVADEQTVQTMLTQDGITVKGTEINEYIWQQQQTPGYTAWYLARLERSHVTYALHAIWDNCCMSGMLDDAITAQEQPTAVWWDYERYANISGELVGLSGSGSIDGVAGTDSHQQRATILLGNNGSTTGSVALNLTNLNAAAYLLNGNQVRVVVEQFPDQNGAPLAQPVVVQDQLLPVSSNQTTVTIPWTSANDAYAVSVGPAGPVALIPSVDGSVTGSGLNQFNYVGNWEINNNAPCDLYECSATYDSTANDYATFTFTGRQIQYFAVKGIDQGIVAVSLDGGPETQLDLYSPVRQADVAVWNSPVLNQGSHTFKIRITGNKNPSSQNSIVVVDRVDILNNTVGDNVTGSGLNRW
jgi:hypothetical protein